MDAKLKSYVDRIENIEVEAKEVGTSKRDVFDEAAKAGYDKKALRRLLRDRKEAAKDKGTADLVEQYRAALGMPGATYRSVAEQTGTSKSKLQRLVPRERNGTTPAATERTGGAIPNAVSEETNQPPQAAPPAIESCGSGESSSAEASPEEAASTPPGKTQSLSSVRRVQDGAELCSTAPSALEAGVAPGPQDPIDWDALNATQPTELRRTQEAQT